MTPRPVGWRQVRHHWEATLLVLPTVLLIGVFQYYPAASGVFHSFFRWNGADISEWVGWRNYLDLLGSTEFWDSFKVAFILGMWNVVKMAPALAVAVCIHRCRSERMQYLYRSLFAVQMVIPGLVLVLLWRSFFFEATAGYLNKFLNWSGTFAILCSLDRIFRWGGVFVPGQSPAWLGDPRLILTACIVWGFPWVGSFAVLTHLAKLQQIPRSMYEAAELDGANWWSTFTRIELPMIMGSVYLLLVFVIIDTIRDAATILALAGVLGGPGGRVTVPALFMFRKAFMEQDMGYACAVGIVLTAVVMTLQKASNDVIEWRSLTPLRRKAWRGTGLAAAAALLAAGRLVPIALLLAAAAFPWGVLRRTPAAAPAPRPKRPAASPGVRPAGDRVLGTESRAQALVLRGLKHGLILGVLATAFLPFYLMATVSFKTNQQFYEAPARLTAPLHWENFGAAWAAVAPPLANSLFITIAATVLTLWFGLWAAYFFARVRFPFSNALWNAVLILMMLPSIANLIPLFRLLGDLHLLNTLTALVTVSVSAGQVFALFVLRNFIADIPQDFFDAAEIDGASHFQQVASIVLPQSGAILGTVGVMHFVGEWNNFLLPLVVMRDHARLPVMVELLRMAGEYIKFWGPLMAGYALASLPIVVLFVFTMNLFVKGLAEGGAH